jgi:hypothetical protein
MKTSCHATLRLRALGHGNFATTSIPVIITLKKTIPK